jgi:nucleotide-binding universal stress UspA family protein
MFETILWATDFSEHASDAGRRALDCAQCSKGKLYALAVVDPEDLPIVLEGAEDPFIPWGATEQVELRLEKEYEERVEQALRQAVAALADSSIEVTTLIRVGTPWREIVKAAKEIGATLIILGSHGKRSLEELLLGSTVENVTRHAPCPVLVVR